MSSSHEILKEGDGLFIIFFSWSYCPVAYVKGELAPLAAFLRRKLSWLSLLTGKNLESQWSKNEPLIPECESVNPAQNWEFSDCPKALVLLSTLLGQF